MLDPATLAGRLQTGRESVEMALSRIATDVAGEDAVSAAVRYALAAGGKRLRPILCVTAFRVASGSAKRDADLFRAACALELIHTYSLVHDDLPCMDDDDLRRGRPTTHRVFGTPAAAAAGVALIPLACRVLDAAAFRMGVAAPDRARAVAELCHGAGAAGMVGGQILDLQAEGAAVRIAALRHIHAMKTGALFRAAMRVGATMAAATHATIDALGEYGLRLGLAFQITDDVLDVTMDAAALGKTPGKDADAGKATYAALLGLDDARDAALREARAAIDVLRGAGRSSPFLDALARFAVQRDR